MFERKNDDIHYNIEISLLEAIFGCSKQVETINGDNIDINIPPGSQGEDCIILKNKVLLLY